MIYLFKPPILLGQKKTFQKVISRVVWNFIISPLKVNVSEILWFCQSKCKHLMSFNEHFCIGTTPLFPTLPPPSPSSPRTPWTTPPRSACTILWMPMLSSPTWSTAWPPSSTTPWRFAKDLIRDSCYSIIIFCFQIWLMKNRKNPGVGNCGRVSYI